MDTTELVREVVFLPIKFYSPGSNKSAFTLLQETGYFENHELVTIENISNMLSIYPQCIKSWIRWSEDKRSDGWYITESKEKPGIYVIGSFRGTDNRTEFTDLKTACATYIKYEAEAIRSIATKKK